MKPEKVFRVGSVSASVFVNQVETESGKRSMRNVVLQRRYRDQSGEWKSSSSLALGDLPQARLALDLVTEYVADKEAAVS